MANGKSQYLQNGFLKAALENTAFTPGVTTVYAALTTATVVSSQTGSTITEVTGDANYARQPITSASGWTPNPPTLGTVANTGSLAFFGAGALAAHTLTSIAICDALTGGNLLYFGDIAGGSKVINPGDTASVAIGAITITES